MMNVEILWALLAGALFSVIGVSFRMAENRGIPLTQLIIVASLAGMPFFFSKVGMVGLGQVPWTIWGWSMLAGASQIVMLYLVAMALRRGPLAPLWCVAMLGFVPVVIYAWFVMGEKPVLLHVLAVVSAGAAVIFSVFSRPATGGETVPSRKGLFVYAGLLLATLMANSLLSMGIKSIGGTPQTAMFTDAYLFGVYVVLFVLAAGILAVEHRHVKIVPTLLLGCIAAIGSVGGFWLLSACMRMPAAVAFSCSSMSCIVCTAIIAVSAFHERTNRAWYLALGSAMLTVFLACA